jgi:hypothetical protein
MYVLLIAVIVVALVVIFWPSREGFEIAKRYGLPCPNTKRGDQKNIPGSLSLVVAGYNYEDVPQIYRNGILAKPLQFFYDANALLYYFTVYAPGDYCDYQWSLETIDKVEPLIYEGLSGRLLKTEYFDGLGGRYVWNFSC